MKIAVHRSEHPNQSIKVRNWEWQAIFHLDNSLEIWHPRQGWYLTLATFTSTIAFTSRLFKCSVYWRGSNDVCMNEYMKPRPFFIVAIAMNITCKLSDNNKSKYLRWWHAQLQKVLSKLKLHYAINGRHKSELNKPTVHLRKRNTYMQKRLAVHCGSYSTG